MNEPASDAYAEVPYPGYAFSQTHPDRLATLATLFGMQPAPVGHCRVLELGAGEGANLIPMACVLPRSRFIGLDLCADAVARGAALISRLGLQNIELRQCDILDVPADSGPFDYLIAHGVYSWVPHAVREKILALCGACLAPQGVAYISYNAYPGGHLRDMTREAMRFHTRSVRDPKRKIEQAGAALKFIGDAHPEGDSYGAIYRETLERLAETLPKYGGGVFYHDALAEENTPFYFHRFIADAASHGLQFLAEADIAEMNEAAFPAPVAEFLRELGGDIVAKEQYMDFLKGRQFRQTLLCRAEIPLDRRPDPARLGGLFIASSARSESAEAAHSPIGEEAFKGLQKAEAPAPGRVSGAVLQHLAEIWPKPISFAELSTAARSRADAEAGDSGHDASDAALGEFILRAHASGFVALHSFVPPFATQPAERPEASALARAQSATQPVVTNLFHRAVRMEGDLARHLLQLLDGTRDRAALLQALGSLIESGSASPASEGQPEAERDRALRALADELEPNLQKLAKLALLISPDPRTDSSAR